MTEAENPVEDYYSRIAGAIPPEFINEDELEKSKHEDLRVLFDEYVVDGGTLEEFLVILAEVCSDMSYSQTILQYLSEVLRQEDDSLALASEVSSKAEEVTTKYLEELTQLYREYQQLVEQGIITEGRLLLYISQGALEELPVNPEQFSKQLKTNTQE